MSPEEQAEFKKFQKLKSKKKKYGKKKNIYGVTQAIHENAISKNPGNFSKKNRRPQMASSGNYISEKYKLSPELVSDWKLRDSEFVTAGIDSIVDQLLNTSLALYLDETIIDYLKRQTGHGIDFETEAEREKTWKDSPWTTIAH